MAMRLTSFTDYGLRMLMRMTRAPERVFSTAELAEELGLPRNHLAKIIQKLAQMELSKPGAGAGRGHSGAPARSDFSGRNHSPA
jgi:Rrf2 family nitric oxide-sensitive transcriptional repressor